MIHEWKSVVLHLCKAREKGKITRKFKWTFWCGDKIVSSIKRRSFHLPTASSQVTGSWRALYWSAYSHTGHLLAGHRGNQATWWQQHCTSYWPPGISYMHNMHIIHAHAQFAHHTLASGHLGSVASRGTQRQASCSPRTCSRYDIWH